MLIETITVPDDYKTLYGLRATIGLREIIVARTSTVALPNRTSIAPQKTGETQIGTVQPIAPPQVAVVSPSPPINSSNNVSTNSVSTKTNTSSNTGSSQNKSILAKGFSALRGGK